MKRISILLAVLIFTFFLSVILTIFYFNHNPPMLSYKESSAKEVSLSTYEESLAKRTPLLSYEESLTKEIPSIEYCELRNNPHQYDGKVMRLTADFYWFMHGYYLYDAACSNKFEGDKTDEAKTAILFYEKSRTKNFEYLQKFYESDKLSEPLKIKAIGRFQYKHSNGSSDGIEDRTSFRFEIYKVESASR